MRCFIYCLFDIFCGLFKIFEAAEVTPVVVVGTESGNSFPERGKTQVSVDNREDARLYDERQQVRRDKLNAGESQGHGRSSFRRRLGNECIDVVDTATDEDIVLVEEQLAGRRPVLNGERRKSLLLFVRVQHFIEIDGADNVYVVDNEGFFGIPFQKKPRGFFKAAAGVEEEVVFAGNFDADAKAILGLKESDDFFGVMVDVDDEFGDAKRFEAFNGDFEEGAAIEFNEGFGNVVGERAE